MSKQNKDTFITNFDSYTLNARTLLLRVIDGYLDDLLNLSTFKRPDYKDFFTHNHEFYLDLDFYQVGSYQIIVRSNSSNDTIKLKLSEIKYLLNRCKVVRKRDDSVTQDDSVTRDTIDEKFKL